MTSRLQIFLASLRRGPGLGDVEFGVVLPALSFAVGVVIFDAAIGATSLRIINNTLAHILSTIILINFSLT